MDVYWDKNKKKWCSHNGGSVVPVVKAGDRIVLDACDNGWLEAIPQGLQFNSKYVLEDAEDKKRAVFEDDDE